MDSNLASSASPEISAPEFLAALQQTITHQGGSSLPLRKSYLNLRAVPQISFDEARGAFSMAASTYPAEWKEQVRQLRDRLSEAQAEFDEPGEGLQTLLFTSMRGSRSRYGTATNLALALSSMQDTRVLVIDANLHSPTLHSVLNLPIGPGLCEATRAERIALPPCFRRITGTQIYLLTAGDWGAYVSDPLDMSGLQELVRSLRTQFDWILIDGPGFDTVDDVMALTMMSDGVVMVIESGHDSFREVSRALGQVRERRLLGAVMF